MEAKTLTVHCFYEKHGPDLQDLIAASFQSYIQTELHIFEKATQDGLS